jgi:peptide chain release factor 1
MHINLQKKLETLLERHEELAALLSNADIINDQKKFRDLSKEYSTLEKLVFCFKKYQQAQQALEDAELLLNDSDAEMR